jgi:hypothetical protein
VVLDELVDVPLVARLRPAALVVAARLFVEVVLKLLEAPRPEAVEVTALTADESHDQAFTASDERDQRSQVQNPADLGDVGNPLAQRQRLPDVVEATAKDGVPMGALAAELLVEERAQAGDVVS